MNEKAADNDNMSWTQEELEAWIKKGLVPQELLDPQRWMELSEFLRKNKEKLHNHYHRNFQEDHFQVKIPPPSEWESAPDLEVIDKRTGKVVRTLEQVRRFELCEGVHLQVKAKELKLWEAETRGAKNLTKEQSENLKAFISKYGSSRPLTRKEIVTAIEEIRKPLKPQKYRQSGHLVDEKLKYSKPNNALTLFDLISPETKQKIKESKIEVKAEGIKLTPPENNLIHALNKLLYEKSQTKDSKSQDFYGGNAPSQLVPYGHNREEKAAVLRFKPSELYKAYLAKEDYSGADIAFINNTLYQLEAKKVLIKYDRIKKTKHGRQEKTLTDRIEDFQSLIKILVFIPDLTDEEKNRLDNSDNSIRDAKGEIVIALNPIFTDQIDTKFIEFPMDTNRRLIIAAGGHNKVTASMQKLMEWLLRDLSAKRYKTEFNEDNLPYMLGLEKYVKQKRKKLLNERINKDVQAMINMGLVLEVEKKPNSTGGVKWIFHLNKNYE